MSVTYLRRPIIPLWSGPPKHVFHMWLLMSLWSIAVRHVGMMATVAAELAVISWSLAGNKRLQCTAQAGKDIKKHLLSPAQHKSL